MTNFTIADCFNVLLMLLVWMGLGLLQGFALGFATNAFRFRTSTLLRQLLLCILFSACACPCLIALAMLGGSFNGVFGLLILFVFVDLVFLLKHKARYIRLLRFTEVDLRANLHFLIFAAIWVVVAFVFLLDIQIGDRLYVSMVCHDQTSIVSYANGILRDGRVPPINPWFYPGHPVPIFYHYYFAMLCALAAKVAGSAFLVRSAVMAGTIWSGIVFSSLLVLASEFFLKVKSTRRRDQVVTLALLAVSNMYIFPVLPVNILSESLRHSLRYYSIGWWTADQVSPLLSTILWVPHHYMACSALIFGCMLLLAGLSEGANLHRFSKLIVAAMCMGSVFGLSAYLGICFAAIVIAYMVLCATRKKYAELAAGLTVLCLGMSFAAPFFLGAIGSGGKGEFPLAFGLRQFEILYLLNSGFARLPEYLQGIVQFCVLPLNYFWGLGFYSLGAMAYWHNRSKSGEQVDARDTLAFIIVLVGFLLGTFVRSRTFNNDFGWRSFMPVVVFCLLWSARYAQEKLRGGIRIDRFVCLQLLTVLIGICTTTYAFVLDRTSLVTSLSGERIYCLRSVYEQLNKTLPNVVMVQQNPTPLMNSSLMAELFFTLFSIHRAPCCTFLDGPWNGPNVPDKAEYELVGRRTKSLFSNISPSLAAQICKTLNIEVLVLQENDPIWNDKSAWIWTYPVLVGTDHVKAFRVGSSVR